MNLYQIADVVQSDPHDFVIDGHRVRLRPAQEATFLSPEEIRKRQFGWLFATGNIWVKLDNKGNLVDYIY